jgi:2-dehydro-3-deoxygluconokinase
LPGFGGDSFGRSFLGLRNREGVERSGVVRAGAPTGLCLITHRPTNHQFSYYRAGSAASLLRPEEIPADLVASARIPHLSGISQAISTGAPATPRSAPSAS